MWHHSVNENKNVLVITKEIFTETALKYVAYIILLMKAVWKVSSPVT